MTNPTNNKAKWSAYQKQYRLDNKIKLKASAKQYNINNKDKLAAAKKQYALDNKQKMKVYLKQYRLDNKDKLKAYAKQFREDNKVKIAITQKQCHKQRMKTDLIYKIKHNLRSLVTGAFKRISKNKPARTEQLLGCSWLEAKAHFERLFQEGMTWENHGEWHIDHIRPVASFKVDELHLMNHISNLQPLWAEENLGSKRVSDMVKWGAYPY